MSTERICTWSWSVNGDDGCGCCPECPECTCSEGPDEDYELLARQGDSS